MSIPWWRARGSSARETPPRDAIGELMIRPMTKADYGFLASVLDRWWGGPSGQRAEPLFYYELGSGALVAEREGAVVGFLFGFFTPDEPEEPAGERAGYIHLVGIHPDHRRQGVGQRLYERFCDLCRARGVTRLKAIAAVGDESAVRFHVALGFDAEEVPGYAGPGRARMVFTRALPPTA